MQVSGVYELHEQFSEGPDHPCLDGCCSELGPYGIARERLSVRGLRAALRRNSFATRGELSYAEEVTADLTPARGAPAALVRLIAGLRQPALIKDRNYVIQNANDAFAAVLGRSSESIVGLRDVDLFTDTQAEFIRERDRAATENGTDLRLEAESLQRADGTATTWETLRVPISTADSSWLVWILEVNAGGQDDSVPSDRLTRGHPLTSRSIEEERLRSERLIVLGQLASGLAHQIRNPLGAISNALALLRRYMLAGSGPVVKQALDIAEEEVWSANRILTDLLDYSRIRTPELSPISIAGVVEAALEAEPLPERVTVEKLMGSELALADFRQCTDAVVKLVRNAAEAMHGEGVLTFASSYEQDFAALTITDTGVGVTEAATELLFEPLVSSKPLGIGLGLAAARALITNQGGTLRCEAVEGGARFVARLPRAPEVERRN